MYKLLIEEELVIKQVLDDHVLTSLEEVPLVIPKAKFTPEFWELLEPDAILTWKIYSWMGKKPVSGFVVRFPWKKGT